MYDYKFVRIELKVSWGLCKPSQDYQAIIREHAKEGWRLLQIFSSSIYVGGNPSFYELIFEREIK